MFTSYEGTGLYTIVGTRSDMIHYKWRPNDSNEVCFVKIQVRLLYINQMLISYNVRGLGTIGMGIAWCTSEAVTYPSTYTSKSKLMISVGRNRERFVHKCLLGTGLMWCTTEVLTFPKEFATKFKLQPCVINGRKQSRGAHLSTNEVQTFITEYFCISQKPYVSITSLTSSNIS